MIKEGQREPWLKCFLTKKILSLIFKLDTCRKSRVTLKDNGANITGANTKSQPCPRNIRWLKEHPPKK